MDVVSAIEENLGKNAIINFKDMQMGDVQKTHADIRKAKSKLGFSPKTNLNEGINIFLEWYIKYLRL